MTSFDAGVVEGMEKVAGTQGFLRAMAKAPAEKVRHARLALATHGAGRGGTAVSRTKARLADSLIGGRSSDPALERWAKIIRERKDHARMIPDWDADYTARGVKNSLRSLTS
jgi:hypothetical protein